MTDGSHFVPDLHLTCHWLYTVASFQSANHMIWNFQILVFLQTWRSCHRKMFNLILINTHSIRQLQRQTGQKTLHAVLFILSFIKPMTEAQAERQFYKTKTNWIFQLPYFSFYFVVRDSCYIVYAVGFSRIVDNNDAYIYIYIACWKYHYV